MIHRGDVVIVDFPYSDRSGSKVRPALVVQANEYNGKLLHTIIALISSSSRRMVGAKTQLLIEISTPEGQKSGLRTDSVVQCDNLLTIDQGFIHRAIGAFSPALMRQIDLCLKASLAISDVP